MFNQNKIEVNIIEIDTKDINTKTYTTTHKHKTHTSRTPDIETLKSFIKQHEDIVAWQTKRSFKSPKQKETHKLINSKLYDLKKKPFLKLPTTITSQDIKQIKAELKHARLNKPQNKKKPSNITDKDYYTPIIIQFLKEHKGTAYTYDSIAKAINYKIIDKDDKKYFKTFIGSIGSKVSSKKYEGRTFYWINQKKR